MFVKANTLGEIKHYFNDQLSDLYSSNEIKLIIKELSINRFKINQVDYISSSEMRLSESDLLFYHNALKRLRNQEPFQYVLGETWFYDLNLKIDSRALIPRPETEELVDWIVKDFSQVERPVIMDLCSGSGCIALALKSGLKDSKVVASEYSRDAISLIEENKTRTNLEIQIEEMDVLKSDAYSVFSEESFDCWVSNPPYIPEQDKALMASNVLEHEPHIALFVDDSDPLIFYREIGLNALKYLKEEGLDHDKKQYARNRWSTVAGCRYHPGVSRTNEGACRLQGEPG